VTKYLFDTNVSLTKHYAAYAADWDEVRKLWENGELEPYDTEEGFDEVIVDVN